MVHTIHDLTSKLFENLEITSPLGVDKRVNYTQRIIRGAPLKKYKTILTECNEIAKGIYGDQWALGEVKDVTTEQF